MDIHIYPNKGLVKSDSRDTLNRGSLQTIVICIIPILGPHEYTIVYSEKTTVGTL